MEGRETFSVSSETYARSRPQYPAELFEWLASQCVGHTAAWDCATGNGQAALGLANYFDRVEATDISFEQVKNRFHAPRVYYSVQPAEDTTFPAASFDLVAVAQALHWFDFERFWPEVRRTSRRDGFFCAWGYAWFKCGPALEAALFTPIRELLSPYWAHENGILWRGYDSEEVRFPFPQVEAPSFSIELKWDIETIVRYVGTWSAYKLASSDPCVARSLATIAQNATALFRSKPLPLTIPLSVIAGRIS